MTGGATNALTLGAILGVSLYTVGTTGTVDAEVLISDGGRLEISMAESSAGSGGGRLDGTGFGPSLFGGDGRLADGTSSSSRGNEGGGGLRMGMLLSPLSDCGPHP